MRKRTGKLYSVFSGLITQYIEYKQNIGCKTTVMECLLKRFDKLANDRNEKVLGISKDLADVWCCRFPGESEDNRYYRIIILRGFSSFLQTIGYDSYIPVLPKHQSNFVPYIYTPDEIIIRKTKCFDFWERNVLFPKTKRSFFRTPKHPLPCPFPLNFSLLIITKKFGNLAKNRYICIV